ncbi:hypothetical protein DL764_006202 [Monosporascus ibericus]|uniref:Cytochrome P450 monooxygenase n=1 Tax=Monosporascus ibericus TaxID=155417 RepID=A0A4Q4T8K2_9PEZI|nr:hypothetical protein DL764_006202 [Monosporascus ibericus]
MQQPLFAKFRAELFLYLRAVMRGKSYLRTVEKMIKTRLASSQHARHDFYSVMEDNMKISERDNVWTSEIWGEAIFSLTAAEEIRSTFASGADIRGPMLAKCQYLRACFDEALRMSPPIPGTLWREEASEYKRATEPLLVDGHVIPPGTQVGVNAYAIHHNKEYFQEPFEFKPERWFPESAESRRTNKNAFVPFSVGARGRAGKAMAYLEAGLVIAKALWYFDFEKAPGEIGRIGGAKGRPDEYHLRDIVVSVHDGPYLTFRPRSNSVKELGGKSSGNDRHAEDNMW